MDLVTLTSVSLFQLPHQLPLFPVVREGSAKNPELEEPGGLAAAQHHTEARLRIAEKVGTIL